MLVFEGCCPFFSPGAGARCSRNCHAAAGRPDPLSSACQHAGRVLALLLVFGEPTGRRARRQVRAGKMPVFNPSGSFAMSSAWLLPDHIADVCPPRPRHIEELRAPCSTPARSYGFELVMPPLLEHLDSLLSGTGAAGPAHLQAGRPAQRPHAGRARRHHAAGGAHRRAPAQPRRVTRLCYCGPVLHTRPRDAAPANRCSSAPRSTATPGLEADLEVRSWRSNACARPVCNGPDDGSGRCAASSLAGAGRRAGGRRGQPRWSALAAKDAGRLLAPEALPGRCAAQALLALPALWRRRGAGAGPSGCCRRPQVARAGDLPGWHGRAAGPSRGAVGFDLADHARLRLLQRCALRGLRAGA